MTDHCAPELAIPRANGRWKVGHRKELNSHVPNDCPIQRDLQYGISYKARIKFSPLIYARKVVPQMSW